MRIAIVAAPEAGQEPLARMLLNEGLPYVVTKTWVTYLAGVVVDSPEFIDTAAFANDLKSVKAAMSTYDHIFYIPIYDWNVVDGKDEDRRVQIDDAINKIFLVSPVEYITVPEGPVWDRARFVLDVVK